MITDNNFKNIPELNYLPWIGENYANKLLIVGESHYGEDNEKRIHEVNHPTFTRAAVLDMGVTGNSYGGKVKFYNNVWRIGKKFNPELSCQDFWQQVSYLNIVQSAMIELKNRPQQEDFQKGITAFFKSILVLKPKYCLMAGLSSFGYIIAMAEQNSYTITNKLVCDKVGRSHPRQIEITHTSGYKTTLIFISHPSRYFSHNAWGNFLLSNFPDLV
jgi:hypothetical protein